MANDHVTGKTWSIVRCHVFDLSCDVNIYTCEGNGIIGSRYSTYRYTIYILYVFKYS